MQALRHPYHHTADNIYALVVMAALLWIYIGYLLLSVSNSRALRGGMLFVMVRAHVRGHASHKPIRCDGE